MTDNQNDTQFEYIFSLTSQAKTRYIQEPILVKNLCR